MPGLITALYRELDPLRPLNADEDDLYVDWQPLVDPGRTDIKTRLAREFLRQATPERPIVRLLTGHFGTGKTTELLRIQAELATQPAGERIFSSLLTARDWLFLDDLAAEDVILQIVRQLVADPRVAGVSVAASQFAAFFSDLWERFRRLRPDTVEVGVDPLTFSFSKPAFPSARAEFRRLLSDRLPSLNDLVTRELLPTARAQLRAQGFADVLLIVDDLDKIEHRTIAEDGRSNQEALFARGADTFRALGCSMLMTAPIELLYSSTQHELEVRYGAAPRTLPAIAVRDRAGQTAAAGEAALAEIAGRRARRARGVPDADPLACARDLFADPSQLARVIQASGGHVRGLLVLLTQLFGEVDELPLPAATVAGYLPRAARALATGLTPSDRDLLRQVHQSGERLDDEDFDRLLRDEYIFRYELGESEAWYDVNPLLLEGQL